MSAKVVRTRPKRMLVVKLPFLSEKIDDVVVMYQVDYDRMVEREKEARELLERVRDRFPVGHLMRTDIEKFLAGEKGASDGE